MLAPDAPRCVFIQKAKRFTSSPGYPNPKPIMNAKNIRQSGTIAN